MVSECVGCVLVAVLSLATELDDILSSPCDSHETIDDALRSWLSFTTEHKG